MITIRYKDENGDKQKLNLPSKKEVCPTCEGEGKHVNRSIDGDGITSFEWSELCDGDPDFSSNYMSGKYDVTCEECNGLRVVSIVDEGKLTDKQKQHYKEWQNEQYEEACWAAEDLATRRAESGGWG